MIDSYKLLGVRILSLTAVHVGRSHDVSETANKMCYTLFCNFISLYERESVIPRKAQNLRMGCPAHFRL